MSRILKKVSTLSMLALSLFLWSCDDIGQSTAPAGELNPNGYALFSSTTGEQFVVVRADEDLGIVSGSIGSAGGELHLGGHKLVVPAGAVQSPTVFTLGRADGDLVRMQLSATRNTYNDVGAAGFAVPVQLTLNFGDASDLPPEADKLEVIFFRPDGLVEPVSTWLDVDGQTATGQLEHFSDFGLGWPFQAACNLLIVLGC